MPEMISRYAVAALMAAATLLNCAAAAEPDENIYTQFTFDTSDQSTVFQSLSYIVCGNTAQSGGCFASGSIGPVGRIGAVIEGAPGTQGNTVTRDVYIVDMAGGSAGTGVILDVYQKADTIEATTVVSTVKFLKSVSLPLVGGPGVACYLAGNGAFLYVGTSASTKAVQVHKGGLTLQSTGEFTPALNVTGITVNDYGYVSVNFGGPGFGTGFYQFAPNGQLSSLGGGNDFLLSTSLGLAPPAPATTGTH